MATEALPWERIGPASLLKMDNIIAMVHRNALHETLGIDPSALDRPDTGCRYYGLLTTGHVVPLPNAFADKIWANYSALAETARLRAKIG